MRPLSAVLLFAFAAGAAQAETATHLLRFPDLHDDRVVFTYGGDLYIAPLAGGTAFRLTSDEGQELYPKFSPDGTQIAFSAEYNGTRQVFVMPAAGGQPRQLTWYNDVGPMPPRGGTDNRVLDWTPDGRNIVVRMNRLPFSEREGRPYLVPADGGIETPMAVPESGGGSMSPDGTKFVYTPIDRDFRSWKRYRGGRAQDVWIYDLAANTSVQLTDDPATDHQPMWLGDTIYFVSDRNDRRLNLYGMPAGGGEPTKLTTFDDFDVLWPSAGPGGIVFEHGGAIWHFDPATGQARELDIRIGNDLPQTMPHYVAAQNFVESFGISPGGERAVFGARGELFTVPAEHGEVRNLSKTPGVREMHVSWSPDGRWIAYLSDQSGEYEIWLRAQDGHGVPRRLSTDGDIWRFAPVWSPDSKKLAFADRRQRLRILDIDSGAITEVDTATISPISDYTWAPDSRWLAYVKTGRSQNTSIWLYSLDAGNTRQLTPEETSELSPAFDPQGRYLYFLSNRDYNLAFSAFEFNYLYQNATRVYAATLAADGPALQRPPSDEAIAPTDTGERDGSHGKNAGKLRIDLPGFNERVVALNAPPGAYVGLSANADGVFYVALPSAGGGRGDLQFLGLDVDAKPQSVAAVTGYALSADGKKLLLRRDNQFAIVDAGPKADFDDGALPLDGMQLRVVPREEWHQLFVDAWRVLRDWFYDPNMHGEDWNAIRARYEPLVADVATRQDLDYLLQELAGEVNSGHVYVQSGDQVTVERHPGGLLGAELVPDASGWWKIAHVLPGENWDPQRRSPLTEPGVDVDEGELILAIDGVSTRAVDNIYRLFENRANEVVTLSVASRPDPAAARDVRVRTIGSETALRYLEWVQQRRQMVERLSGGRIGYIHLPNTAIEGNRELFRGMLAYASREALIIDDRYNGGGFIPDRMIELLNRTPLNYWKRRGLEPQATPLLSHLGPKAMLINGLSSSGGDALPYYFRKLGLGPLIGTRTWGGLIGIEDSPTLADGGAVLPAAFRFMATDGQWAVEDQGVSPDIRVVDRPELIAAGRDPSLEAAVQYLLQQLEQHPVVRPTAPPSPTQFP